MLIWFQLLCADYIFVVLNYIKLEIIEITFAVTMSHFIKWAPSTVLFCNNSTLSRLEPVRCQQRVITNQSLHYFRGGSKHLLHQVHVRVLGRDETLMLKGGTALTGADVTCLSNDLLLSLLWIKIVWWRLGRLMNDTWWGWGQVDGEGKQRLQGDKCVCVCVFFSMLWMSV